MTLHIVSCSPDAGDGFAQCLRVLAPDDGLLLLGDGVYAALERGAQASALQELPASIAIHALSEDCIARGVSTRLLARVQGTDYSGFVALACAHARSVSWF